MRYERSYIGLGFAVHAVVRKRTLCGLDASFDVHLSGGRRVTCRTCARALNAKGVAAP